MNTKEIKIQEVFSFKFWPLIHIKCLNIKAFFEQRVIYVKLFNLLWIEIEATNYNIRLSLGISKLYMLIGSGLKEVSSE